MLVTSGSSNRDVLPFQGSVNGGNATQPTGFFDAGALDFDWPSADGFWHDTLQKEGRVRFEGLQPTLCASTGRRLLV